MHVSTQIVKAPSTDTTRPASAPASSSSFSAAFASASEAGTSQKAQSTAKQASDKKSARDKTASADTATASTIPVVPWLSQPAAPAALGIPTVATAPDNGDKGDTGTNGDVTMLGAPAGAKRFSEIGTPGDNSVAPATGDQAAPSSDLTSAGADAATPSTSGTAPLDKSDATVAKTDVLSAAPMINPLPASGQADGLASSDGTTSTTPAALPDAPTQAIAAAQPAPAPQATPAQPWSVSSDKVATTVEALGASSLKVQSSTVAANDSLTKQSIGTSKDRGAQPDIRSKRKTDDSDTSTSDAKADGSFAAKIPLQVQQLNAQPDATTHHGADAQAFQQAMQGATSTGTGNTPATFNAADNNAAAAQVPVPAGTPSAHTATDVQALPAVNSAHLIQSMGQSEMKLGMHSAEFGSISINTSVTHDVLSAQISTSHAALGQALTVHLPSIEERLGSTYGLQARVEVRDSSSSASGDSTQQSRDGRQNQGSGGSTSGSSSSSSSTSNSGWISGATVRSTSLSLGASRLDIRI